MLVFLMEDLNELNREGVALTELFLLFAPSPACACIPTERLVMQAVAIEHDSDLLAGCDCAASLCGGAR